jgi:hypothetical protein
MSAVQIIKPKSNLSAKVGRVPAFDPSALARAEAALNSLSHQFDDWMKIEAEKLAETRDAGKADGWSDAALADLFTRAHDIKGLGSTYKFPIASQLAASLCKLLEADRTHIDRAALAKLASAHVEAIRAVVRDGVRDDTHPVAAVLLRELAGQTATLTAAA